MKNINLLYWAIPFLCWALWVVFQHIGRVNAAFYGFAENKETGINLDHAAAIKRIWVKPGQFVQKGALLLEVTRLALDFKLNEVSSQIAEMESRDRWRVADIKARIEQVRAERAEKVSDISARIRLLESEQELNKRLAAGIESVGLADPAQWDKGPSSVKLEALRTALRVSVEPLDREIARLNQELALAGAPARVQTRKLEKEAALYREEQERLSIYAPDDGLIGSVHCKEGENTAAFATLISFYEQNPNMVVGYVHESLSLRVQPGDSLLVTSSLHPAEQCMGRVSGLGHRVVEIPERLRKIPEIRTYGREVLIEIPGDNQFLQKEKVYLQWPGEAGSPIRMFFTRQFSTR